MRPLSVLCLYSCWCDWCASLCSRTVTSPGSEKAKAETYTLYLYFILKTPLVTFGYHPLSHTVSRLSLGARGVLTGLALTRHHGSHTVTAHSGDRRHCVPVTDGHTHVKKLFRSTLLNAFERLVFPTA